MSQTKHKRTVRVGSRESRLAVAQTKIVIEAAARAHPEIEFELVTMRTQGDRFSAAHPDSVLPSSRREIVKGLFVKELETALDEGRIDFAVHSLKDMSVFPNEALPIVAISPREVPYDVAVFRRGLFERGISEVAELAGLCGGCASARRRIQLQMAVDCRIKPVRGNIITRLDKLDNNGEYDFLVVAAAGLLRLGLQERIGYCFADDVILPPPGQGVLACQGRRGESYDYLQCFHDREVELCVTAERSFAAATGGGCSSPVAAHARIVEGELLLDAFFADEEEGICQRGRISGAPEDGRQLGEELARRLVKP